MFSFNIGFWDDQNQEELQENRKKLLRADAIPLLFPRLLCKILKHRGYAAEPQHERKRFCREIFTLDKWASMTAYGGADQGAPAGPEQPEQPEKPVEPPVDTQSPAPAMTPSEPPPEIPSSAPEIKFLIQPTQEATTNASAPQDLTIT